MKLKDIILKNLIGASTPEELSKRILDLNIDYDNITEGKISKKFIFFLVPFLLGYYSKDFINKTLELLNKNNDIQNVESEASIVNRSVEKYSKKYNINSEFVKKILYNESSFKIDSKKYDANIVGDSGKSFGPGQVQMETAEWIWKKYPESDVKKVDKDRLLNDIDFNIRTLCKTLGYYYNEQFDYIKDTKKRFMKTAMAYNMGLSKSKKIKNYKGKYAKVASNLSFLQ